jgi:uncharacterized RDD family membrane protein YckC
MIYAGFGKRLAANLVDIFVFLPFGIAQVLLTLHSETWTAISSVLSQVLILAYNIFCHARWGQTLGKRAVGIRVVKVSGERLTWREAVLRSLVDVVLTIFYILRMAPILFPDPEAMWLQWVIVFSSLWIIELDIFGQVWFWSELVTMLFNKKKRALHDFIAGTVVIQEQPATLEHPSV